MNGYSCFRVLLYIRLHLDLYLMGVVFFSFFFSFLLSPSLLIGRHFPDIHPPNLAYSGVEGGGFVRRPWLIIGKTPKIRLLNVWVYILSAGMK